MKNFKQFLRTTRAVFRIYWEIAPGLTLGFLITQIIISLSGVVNAYIFGIFLDRVISIINGSKDIYEVLVIIILFAAVSLVLSLAGVLNNYYGAVLGAIDSAKLRLKQIDFMVKLGITQMEDPELNNKSTRFTEIYNSINQHLGMIFGLIATIVSTIVYGVVIYSFAPILVILFVIFFLLKYINNGRFINRIWKLTRDHTEERRKAWDSAGSLASPPHLKETLLSNGVALLRDKFVNFTNWHAGEFRNIRSRWAFFEIFHTTSDVVFDGIGIYLLVQKAIVGALSLGTFTFYMRSIFSFSGQLDTLSYRIARAIESNIRIQDALEFFELYKPESDGEISIPESETPLSIELSNITFKYPNGKRPVIENLNLEVKSGERIAIVGENGAGKTTLVKLLTRIYRPQEGQIRMGGININEVKKESLYEKLGVLFQDFNTYGNLTVKENIEIGKPTRKVEEKLIEKALEKADALSFIKKYPHKLDQTLSERYKGGIRPSGGQWQKIAIARFFYRNAPILILDEPTASIDAVSEAKIFDNVYKFMKGKTVIIISHRFSTVRNADRILVLDKGKIIEEGTHEELIKKDGKYAHAFKLQAKGYS